VISVIITCYNLGRYLPECIESVLNQTYKNFEIILIDDGSTDMETILYLDQLKADYIDIHRQTNRGVSVARNYGASFAKGDFLLFLDGDDKIGPEYFSLAISACENDLSLNYIYCDMQEFENGTNYRSLAQLKIETTLLHAGTHVSAIIKRELWERSGGFNPDFLHGWEDWDFLIRLLQIGLRAYKIPKGLLLYRIRNESRDQTGNKFYNTELEQLLFKSNISAYINVFPCPITLLREHKAQQSEIEDLRRHAGNIYNTFSYRLGAFLLSPVKWLAKIIKHKNV